LTDTGTTLPATLSTIEGKIDTVDTVADSIAAKTDNLPEGIKKNTAWAVPFSFEMLDETDGYTLETGASVTASMKIDGAGWASMTNSVAEEGSTATYEISIAAADTNGTIIAWRFVADGCRTLYFRFKTEE